MRKRGDRPQPADCTEVPDGATRFQHDSPHHHPSLHLAPSTNGRKAMNGANQQYHPRECLHCADPFGEGKSWMTLPPLLTLVLPGATFGGRRPI